MSLSNHLLQSFEHQRALHKHNLDNPDTAQRRQPFTPQYIITEPQPKPVYDPPASEAYSTVHGKPTRGWSGSSHTIPKVEPEDQVPPITQKPPQNMASSTNPFAATPLTAVSSWDMGGSEPPSTAVHMGLSEYTAGQISTLQSRLAKKLGPEYINNRPGPGGGPQLR
jgi:hypothetical protein